MWDALQACVDLAAQVAETLGQDAGLSAEQAQCMAEGYVAAPEFREAIFSEGFDPELNARIDAALGVGPPGLHERLGVALLRSGRWGRGRGRPRGRRRRAEHGDVAVLRADHLQADRHARRR